MKTYKVLHIEDNIGDQILLKEYAETFELISISLDQASTFDEGLNFIHRKDYDLIILDLGLPNREGVGNVRSLIEIDPHLNILVLSGDRRNEIVLKAVEIGANDYLLKDDLNSRFFERTIQICIQRHRLKQEKEQLKTALNYRLSKLDRLESEKSMYVVRTDLEGNYVFYNKRFQDAFLKGQGLNFIGKHSLAHIIEEDHPKAFEAVQRALDKPGVPQPVELQKPGYLQGTILHTYWEFTAVNDHNGKPCEILCIGYDLADVVQKIEAQEVEKELNKIAFNYSSDLILTLNEQFEILSASPSAWDLFGYKSGELEGGQVLKLIHKEDREALRSAFKNKEDKPDSFQAIKLQHRIQHSDKKYFWVESHLNYYRGLSHNSVFILISRIIEDEKKLLEELSHASEEYKALYEASPGSILITDFETGRIINCNNEFNRLFGYDTDDILGKTTVEIGLWESKRERDDTFKKLAKDQRQHSLQINLFDKYKNSIPALIQMGVVETTKEKKLVSIILDNRDLHSKNLKLKNTEKLLRHSKANLNNTLNSIPHEIWALNLNYEVISLNAVFKEQFKRYYDIDLQIGSNLNKLKGLSKKYLNIWKRRYDLAFKGKSKLYIDRLPSLIEKGKEEVMSFQISPTYDDQGQIIGANVFGENVSELYQKTDQLNTTNKNLVAAESLAKIGNWHFDYINNQFDWSFGMSQIFDFKSFKNKPESIFDLITKVDLEDRKDFIRKYRSALKSFRRFKQTLRLRTTKQTKFIEISVFPKKEKNKIIKVEGVCRDITAIHLARLKENRQRIFFKRLAKASLKFIGAESEKEIHKLYSKFLSQWLGRDFYLLTSSRLEKGSEEFFKVEQVLNPYSGLLKPDFKSNTLYPVNAILNQKLSLSDSNILELDLSGFSDLGFLDKNKLEILARDYPNSKTYIYRFFFEEKVQGICFLSFLKGVPDDFDQELFNNLGNQVNSSLKAIRSKVQLKESSAVLNEALAGAMAGVWRYDLNSRIIYGDQHFSELVRTEGPICKIQIEDSLKRIHPDDLEDARAAFSEYLSGERDVYQTELRYKCFDGQYRWFEDKGRVTSYDEDGNPIEITGIRLNIEKRKQRQERLHLFENVLDNARDGILITDNSILSGEQPIILYANRAMENISGYTEEELVGKSPKILRGPDTQGGEKARISEALRAGESIQSELINYTKSGEPYWASLNILPVKDEQGKVSHFVSLQRNVSSERIKQEEYKDLSTRLELALGENEIGIWDLDLDKNVLLWDDNMYAIYGIAKDQFENKLKDWQSALHEDDFEKANENFEKAVKNGSSTLNMRFRIRTNRGIKHISTRAKIIRDEQGNAHRVIGLNWDITQIASYEEELANTLNERENILSSVNEGFISLNSNLKITYLNPAAARILKLSEDLNPNLFSINQVFPFHAHKGLYDCIDDALQNGATRGIITYYHDNGKWIDLSIYPQSNGLSIFIQDITELRKRQSDLERLKQNTEALINTTEDHIWSVDNDFKILSANKNYLEYLSKMAAKPIKTGDSALINTNHPDHHTNWESLYSSALKGEEVQKLIEEKHDGKEVIYSVHLYPIYNQRKIITGVACYSYDATERLTYLRTVEKQNQRLQEIAWLQSHVLRAPLARIMGLVDLIDMEQATLKDDTSLYLKHIMDSAQEMDKVVRDITDKTKEFEQENKDSF